VLLALPPHGTWQARPDSKYPRRRGEVPQVECSQAIGAAIHRRIQDHRVSGILQLTPRETAMVLLDPSTAKHRLGHQAN